MKQFIIFISMLFVSVVYTYAESKPDKGLELPATILLITSDDLKQAWQPFADWKTRTGKATKVISTSEIGETFDGKDLQEKIRRCCLSYIDNHHTEYVILGGDSSPLDGGIVPDRDTIHKTMSLSHPDIPTDAYYISTTNWDANKNGVYGEWPVDMKDVNYTHPKASIGRIPVRTAEEIKDYTDKIIAYESQYPKTELAQKMIYTCPVPGAQPKLATSRETIEQAWDEGDLNFFFESRTPWDERQSGDFDLSPQNWVNVINKKEIGKMHIHGHGFLPVWVLENHKSVNKSHVAKLKNKNAYLTMTTVSCFTGQYDGEKDPSITESMLRAKDKGAVIVIAPAREGVPAFHNPRIDYRLMVKEGKMDGTTQLLTRLWEIGLENRLSFGEAFSQAKRSMKSDALKTSSYHYVLSEINLLGDPSLSMRPDIPQDVTLTLTKSLAINSEKLMVQTGLSNTEICLWKENELYQVIKTNENGDAEIDLDLKTKGQLYVSAYGPNLNTKVEIVQITN